MTVVHDLSIQNVAIVALELCSGEKLEVRDGSGNSLKEGVLLIISSVFIRRKNIKCMRINLKINYLLVSGII